jgi:hypothetical protein
VTQAAEKVPVTFAWSHVGNPYSHIHLQESLFTQSPDDVQVPKRLPHPVLLTQVPAIMSPEMEWLLTRPLLRAPSPAPFFFSPDLSNGFNPAHGLPPVPCFNEIDNQRPPPIQWIADVELPDIIPHNYDVCHCHDSDCRLCHRIVVEDRPTMIYGDDGKIDLAQLSCCRALVMECNEECSCSALSCRNRVVANGSRVMLYLARAPAKSGWEVRSVDFVPKGTFVCEYLGSVIVDPDVAEEMGKEYDARRESYLFDLDAYGVDDAEMLTMDPSRAGNVSRFINHSCDPNLLEISIGTVSSTVFHRIAFFAARDIYPNEDLGFHYCYKLDQGNPDRFIRCNCGSPMCRTRLR